jgi:Skp family chaperone for outer membrane proteins
MAYNSRRTVRNFAVTGFTWFALLPVNGCVMQSTYDAAIQEGVETTAELERAREEQSQFARLVRDYERLNADTVREAETTTAAVQQAKDDAERERQAAEQYIGKLKQRIAQATKQHNALQYELTVAKENTAALQELIEVYQRKVRDGGTAGSPAPRAAEPAVQKPFDPSTIPQPQDLPVPVVEPPKPAAAPTTPLAKHPISRPQEPVDPGWFSNVKNWLVSLWQSVFS